MTWHRSKEGIPAASGASDLATKEPIATIPPYSTKRIGYSDSKMRYDKPVDLSNNDPFNRKNLNKSKKNPDTPINQSTNNNASYINSDFKGDPKLSSREFLKNSK